MATLHRRSGFSNICAIKMFPWTPPRPLPPLPLPSTPRHHKVMTQFVMMERPLGLALSLYLASLLHPLHEMLLAPTTKTRRVVAILLLACATIIFVCMCTYLCTTSCHPLGVHCLPGIPRQYLCAHLILKPLVGCKAEFMVSSSQY